MEISGRILREVEFRDRLRGYDTDEVDEFLEKVAVGVDELHAQLAAATQRAAEVAEHSAEPVDLGFPDDAAIRRTLVLAQRTADLAIKEAESEAQRLLEDARAEAESTIARAQDDAQRARDAAEFGLQARVTELTEQRNRLEREIEALSTLVEKERERLSDALSSALRFVNDALVASEEFTSARPAPAPPAPAVPELASEPAGGPGTDLDAPVGAPAGSVPAEPDLDEPVPAERGVDEEPPTTGGLPRFDFAEDLELDAQIVEPTRTGEGPGASEDEELWARWARSSPLEDEHPPGRRPGLFDRDPRQP